MPVIQCAPRHQGDWLFWLKPLTHSPKMLNLVFKEDYELMHHRMGHPSKEVLRCALQNTKGFPNIKFPWSDPICPGCAQGKMPQ